MEEIFLSDELMFEILFQIPVKTLFRFKCVCKRWRRLISDPTFLKRWRSLPPLISGFYYFHEEKEVVGKLKFHPCQADPSNLDIDSNLHFLTRSASVVASHNGILLCVENPRNNKLVVCNRFTKQWIALPGHPGYPYNNITMSLYCYRKNESISDNDIEFSEEGIEFNVVIHPGLYYPAEVKLFYTYSSETGEWKTSWFSDSHGTHLWYMALIRGSAYLWGSYNHFCIYDFKNETITFKKLPGNDDQCFSGLMAESAESVYCIRFKATGVCMWELNGNCEWTKVHEVSANSFKNHLPPDYWFANFYKLQYILVDRKLFLERYDKVEILLYDMGTRQIQLLENIKPSTEFPFVAYSLPAWPLCLKTPK